MNHFPVSGRKMSALPACRSRRKPAPQKLTEYPADIIRPDFPPTHLLLTERYDGRVAIAWTCCGLDASALEMRSSDRLLSAAMAEFVHITTACAARSIERSGIVARSHGRVGGRGVFVPRAVAAAEVRRVRYVPQGVGWQYLPAAHGRPPCPCPACLPRGGYKVARLRRRFPYEEPPRPTSCGCTAAGRRDCSASGYSSPTHRCPILRLPDRRLRWKLRTQLHPGTSIH